MRASSGGGDRARAADAPPYDSYFIFSTLNELLLARRTYLLIFQTLPSSSFERLCARVPFGCFATFREFVARMFFRRFRKESARERYRLAAALTADATCLRSVRNRFYRVETRRARGLLSLRDVYPADRGREQKQRQSSRKTVAERGNERTVRSDPAADRG